MMSIRFFGNTTFLPGERILPLQHSYSKRFQVHFQPKQILKMSFSFQKKIHVCL